MLCVALLVLALWLALETIRIISHCLEARYQN